MNNTFYLLVVGSRTFNDYSTMCTVIDGLLINHRDDHIIVVNGGARGADNLSTRYAKERNYETKIFPADWSKGKNAGFVRNEAMHKFISEQPHRGVVAFWDGKSKGTSHSFELAKKYNNQIRCWKFTVKEEN